MTMQSIFNQVWEHFKVKKMPRSFDKETMKCRYSGTGCAIGCLREFQAIYRPEFGDVYIRGLIKHFSDVRELFEGIQQDFLTNLQFLHDLSGNWTTRGNLRVAALKEFSVRYELEIPSQ